MAITAAPATRAAAATGNTVRHVRVETATDAVVVESTDG
jgi:hypothetical protein